jgi:hypothetical protein
MAMKIFPKETATADVNYRPRHLLPSSSRRRPNLYFR